MQERQSDRVIRVFICDDNTLQLGVLSDSLSEYADITVVGTAVDGEAALLQIARLKPDIVVCDMVMPNLDDFGLLEQVAHLQNPPQVIILTALRGENFISQAQELGAAYYMVKPVNPAVLAQRIYTIAGLPRRSGEEERAAAASVNALYARPIGEQISAMLMQIRVPAHLNGYRYLRSGVEMALKQPELLENGTYSLYPAIAKEYDTTAVSVERAIRHAINAAWNRGGPEEFSRLMGCHLESCDKPTNCELLSCLVEALRYQKDRG